MNLSAAEQAVVEDMVAIRSVDLERPPWMQPHRMRIVQKEASRRIAALPPRPKSPTGRSGEQTYWAARRVIRVGSGKHAIHESDGDLPICQLGSGSPRRTSLGNSWVPARWTAVTVRG